MGVTLFLAKLECRPVALPEGLQKQLDSIDLVLKQHNVVGVERYAVSHAVPANLI
jgi:hypothetical protein